VALNPTLLYGLPLGQSVENNLVWLSSFDDGGLGGAFIPVPIPNVAARPAKNRYKWFFLKPHLALHTMQQTHTTHRTRNGRRVLSYGRMVDVDQGRTD
jgi:hypothetical protein